MVLVLLIAVIILAAKKYQIYYIDDKDIDEPKKEHKKTVMPSVRLPKKKAEPVQAEPVRQEEQVQPEEVKAPEPAIQEPDFSRPDAPTPQDQTDTTFVPEMNNVPPVNHTAPTPKAPDQKLKGVRITISVGSQHTTAEVSSFPCLIGREADRCDVIISEPAVSRRHARFLKEGEDIFIEDVSEHNGTFLNEMKIPPQGKARLHEGDMITLGRAHIRIDAFLYE
jgi:hypothetical protein